MKRKTSLLILSFVFLYGSFGVASSRAAETECLINGKVLDREGCPIKGALVAVCPELKENSLWSESSDKSHAPGGGEFRFSYVETRSGENGLFCFKNLPGKNIRFTFLCWKEGFAPALVQMRDGENLIYLKKGSPSKIHIKDGNGEPLAGIALFMKPLDMDFRKTIEVLLPVEQHEKFRTDADGMAEIPNIPPGDYEVLFEKSGILLKKNPVITVSNDSEIDLELPVYPAFSFHVISGDGEPVANADIEYITTEKTKGKTASDEMGLVKLFFYTSDIPDAMVKISAEEYAPKGYPLKEIPSVVILEKYGTVSGKAVDKENHPVSSFTVELEGFYNPENNTGAEGRKEAFNSEEGSFNMERIEPGTRQIIIDSPGSSELHKEIEVKSGKNTDIGGIILSEGITIDIEVIDEEKKPLSGATVKYNTRSSIYKNVERDSRETDYEGKVKWEGLEKQEYTIHVEHEDYARQIKKISLENTSENFHNLVFEMKTGCACQGYLIDHAGEPVSDAYIRITAPGNNSQTTKTGSDGYFEIKECTSGKARIIARGESWALIKDFYITEENCVEPFTLNLAEPSVSGKLLWNGKPLSGSIYWNEDAYFSAGGDSGEFRLYGMEPGSTYRFGTLLKGNELSIPNNVSVNFELSAGAEQDIEFNAAELTAELPECYGNRGIKLAAAPLNSLFNPTQDSCNGASCTGFLTGGKYYLSFAEPGEYLLYFITVKGNAHECINEGGYYVKLERGSSLIIRPGFHCQ